MLSSFSCEWANLCSVHDQQTVFRVEEEFAGVSWLTHDCSQPTTLMQPLLGEAAASTPHRVFFLVNIKLLHLHIRKICLTDLTFAVCHGSNTNHTFGLCLVALLIFMLLAQNFMTVDQVTHTLKIIITNTQVNSLYIHKTLWVTMDPRHMGKVCLFLNTIMGPTQKGSFILQHHEFLQAHNLQRRFFHALTLWVLSDPQRTS